MVQTVVNDSLQFDYNADVNRYKSIDYAFKSLKQDSTLITNSAREEFIELTEDENIGLLNAVSDSLVAGNTTEAGNINEVIVDTNLIEANRKSANDIIISWKQGNVHSTADTITLESISMQAPVEGGKGVYHARGSLRKKIVDKGSVQMRLAQMPAINIKTHENAFIVFPNPATGFVYIKSLNSDISISEITVLDVTGRELLFSFNKGSFLKLDLSNLVAGSYTLKVKDITGKNFVKQIVLTK